MLKAKQSHSPWRKTKTIVLNQTDTNPMEVNRKERFRLQTLSPVRQPNQKVVVSAVLNLLPKALLPEKME